MFTIKLITSYGIELIQSSKYTMLRPGVESQSGFPCLTFCSEMTGQTEDIFEGDIYIMNESGRTVADYHLGKIERPWVAGKNVGTPLFSNLDISKTS